LLLRWRWAVLAFYALLLPPGAYYAAKVRQDNAVDRIVVPTDPDYVNNQEFQKVFGAGEYAVLVAEADDVFAPQVLGYLDRLERALAAVPRVQASSAISIFRRARAGFEATPEQATAFRQFVSGTDLLRRQGLVGDGFLAVALILTVHGTEERSETLNAVDQVIQEHERGGSPLRALVRLGQPYVTAYLDRTQRSLPVYFLLFTAFVVAVNLSLYRSVATLAAFLITLGVCLAVSVGYVGVTGGTFTIVSPMVPMTVLVTAMASLVYIHSRFVERPDNVSVDEHQMFALTNKFLPVTASIFATAVGFGALAISELRPIREMGIWVAVGLLFTWVIVFTLFPVLQKILQTPTSVEQRTAAQWFARFTGWLPGFSYRWRWPLVLSVLVLSFLGGVGIFGLPGVVAPVPLLIDPLEYINPNSELYRDTKRLGAKLPGLAISEVWLKGKLGDVAEPEVLTGLDRFQTAMQAVPKVGSAIGVTTILRIIRYVGGEGDAWPSDAASLDKIAADLETLASTEPLLGRFVQPHSLAQTHVAVISRATEYEDFVRLDEAIRRVWQETVAANPALKAFDLKIVGLAPLQAKMSQSLVPTLTHSFALTVVIIFSTFLVIFRNGTARIMAMIPSVFAILAMFGVMRLSGMMLNVATILIASTVLGTSENDQIHFFYHFLERRRDGSVEQALQHTLRVSGRAILFATLINACGFLAFAMGDLPVMRQFAVLSALAFVLSMIADFTALPAALWILFRQKPDGVRDRSAR
jgi:uncharacterized protein